MDKHPIGRIPPLPCPEVAVKATGVQLIRREREPQGPVRCPALLWWVICCPERGAGRSAAARSDRDPGPRARGPHRPEARQGTRSDVARHHRSRRPPPREPNHVHRPSSHPPARIGLPCRAHSNPPPIRSATPPSGYARTRAPDAATHNGRSRLHGPRTPESPAPPHTPPEPIPERLNDTGRIRDHARRSPRGSWCPKPRPSAGRSRCRRLRRRRATPLRPPGGRIRSRSVCLRRRRVSHCSPVRRDQNRSSSDPSTTSTAQSRWVRSILISASRVPGFLCPRIRSVRDRRRAARFGRPASASLSEGNHQV